MGSVKMFYLDSRQNTVAEEDHDGFPNIRRGELKQFDGIVYVVRSAPTRRGLAWYVYVDKHEDYEDAGR